MGSAIVQRGDRGRAGNLNFILAPLLPMINVRLFDAGLSLIIVPGSLD